MAYGRGAGVGARAAPAQLVHAGTFHHLGVGVRVSLSLGVLVSILRHEGRGFLWLLLRRPGGRLSFLRRITRRSNTQGWR
jgi:hypothetical protein